MEIIFVPLISLRKKKLDFNNSYFRHIGKQTTKKEEANWNMYEIWNTQNVRKLQPIKRLWTYSETSK